MSEPLPIDADLEQERRPNTWAIVSLMLACMAWIYVIQALVMYYAIFGTSPWWKSLVLLRGEILWFVTKCLVGASIVCGWMGIRVIRQHPTRGGEWSAYSGIALSLFVGVVYFTAPGEALSPKRERSRSIACVANLKAIAIAVTMYAQNDPFGRAPTSLKLLENEIYLRERNGFLMCPKYLEGYAYKASNRAWPSNGTEIAVYCPGEHRGKITVLYMDGRVAVITQAELNQSLAAPR